MRGGLKLARMKHGDVEGMTLYTATLARKAPDLVADLWKQTLAHMVSGKDAEDRTSAGGWNKRELDSFLNILQVVGWQRPILPEVEEEPAAAPSMR